MNFEILTEITDVETIAKGRGVHARRTLNNLYGHGRWRKMKGKAFIQLSNGDIRYASLV